MVSSKHDRVSKCDAYNRFYQHDDIDKERASRLVTIEQKDALIYTVRLLIVFQLRGEID